MIRKFLRLPGLLLRLALEDVSCLFLPQSTNENILLIKLDAIGDFIIWLGCVEYIQRHYQSRKLLLVCSASVAEIASASGLFDVVIPLHLKFFQTNLSYRLCLLRRVRRLGCSTAVQTTFSRRFLLGESIIRCCGALRKIGSMGDTNNMSPLEKKIADCWYTQLLPANSAVLNELDRQHEFLVNLGAQPSEMRLASLTCLPWPETAEQPSRSYLVLFPGAGSAVRRWPCERFAEVAKALVARYGLQVVICGTASDSHLAISIASLMPNTNVINLCGLTNLLQLIGVISSARLLVANETSAIHIAAATSTPSVCLLGGGHYGRFVPYPISAPKPHPIPVFSSLPCFHCNWQCIYPLEPDGPAPCLEAITVDMALSAAQKALAFSSSRSLNQ